MTHISSWYSLILTPVTLYHTSWGLLHLVGISPLMCCDTRILNYKNHNLLMSSLNPCCSSLEAQVLLTFSVFSQGHLFQKKASGVVRKCAHSLFTYLEILVSPQKGSDLFYRKIIFTKLSSFSEIAHPTVNHFQSKVNQYPVILVPWFFWSLCFDVLPLELR